MLLVNLINSLSLNDDNLVVMGYSMGGLVARYALAWMESNGQDHHTRLYISHDSPHKGANFPLGLQELIEDINNNASIVWIAVNIIIRTFEYNMPAARQMLVYHYSNSKDGIAKPSDDKINLFDELYNLNPTGNGYPTKPLKIAISNGNYSGKTQRNDDGTLIYPGDDLLYFDYWKNNGYVWIPYPFCRDICCSFWDFKGCRSYYASDHMTATVKIGFDDTAPLEKFSFYSLGKNTIGNTGKKLPMGGSGEQTFDKDNYSYDIAPGSHSSYFLRLLKNNISTQLTSNVNAITNTCFIPTVSALDLNIDISSSFSLQNSRCTTNFDYIYANLTSNIDHFKLTTGAKNFIMTHLFSDETPTKPVVYDEVNIAIPANTVVVSGVTNYRKSASNNIYNEGAFTLKSGSNSTFIAGNTILLKPGFIAESGANLNANIAELMCENAIEFNPHHLASFKSGSKSGNEIINTYDCENIELMPSYSPDSTYFDCYPPSSNESVDSILSENITIYPNPTIEIFTIELSNEIDISNLKVMVYNINSGIIQIVDPVTSNLLTFDISSCLPGLITITFDFNNGGYLYSRKIIKQ